MKRLWKWASGNDERSWISHALIAIGITIATHNPGLAVGYYAFREAEQVAMTYIYKTPRHWKDHVMDVVAPAGAVGIWTLIFG